MRWQRLTVIGVIAVLCPLMASAQSTFDGVLGAAISHGFEDNILAQPSGGPQISDSVTRLGPIVEGGYRSDVFHVTAHYEALAERYWTHPELDRTLGRQDGLIDVGYAPTPHLAFALTGNYVDTYSPVELGTLDILALGRVHASRALVVPQVVWAPTPMMTLTVGYDVARESVANLATGIIQTPRIVVQRRLDRRTSYRVGYRTRRFTSVAGLTESSYTMAGGVVRQMGHATSLEFDAGPRLFEGTVRPDISALLRHTLRRSELLVGYLDTESSVLGEVGLLTMRELRVGYRYQLGRDSTIEVTPRIFRNDRANLYANVASTEVASTLQLNPHVALLLEGQGGRQWGTLGGAYREIPYYSASTSLRITMGKSRATDRTSTPDAARDVQGGGREGRR